MWTSIPLTPEKKFQAEDNSHRLRLFSSYQIFKTLFLQNVVIVRFAVRFCPQVFSSSLLKKTRPMLIDSCLTC